MKKLNLLFIGVIILLTSCNSSKDIVKMTVASEKRMAMGVAPVEVLLVKEGDSEKWSYFYSNIEGFNYEPGYEYVLEVKKNIVEAPVPADASSIKYVLVKEVSKTSKISENLPEDIHSQKTIFTWTGKVVEIQEETLGRGAAVGKFPVKIVKIEVTALNTSDNSLFKQGDTIHAELIKEPNVIPVVAKEYVFKAKASHPAHALGVYLLDTNVQDLVQ